MAVGGVEGGEERIEGAGRVWKGFTRGASLVVYVYT